MNEEQRRRSRVTLHGGAVVGGVMGAVSSPPLLWLGWLRPSMRVELRLLRVGSVGSVVLCVSCRVLLLR